MNKLQTLILMLLPIMAMLTGCEDKNEPEDKISISLEQLVGIWDATDVQFNNDGKWINITNKSNLAMEIWFYDDNMFYGHGALGTGRGAYTLEGNTIKTYVGGQLYATYVVKWLLDDVAELSMTMDKQSMLIRVKKSKISLYPNDLSLVLYVGNGYGAWESEKMEGNHYIKQNLWFDEYNAHWYISDYTLDANGGWVITFNGEKFRTSSPNEQNTRFDYTYDGKVLILRDDYKHETEWGALVNGNTLTLSNGGQTTLFTKVKYADSKSSPISKKQ